MEPNYVATKSVLGEHGGKIALCVLFCWLIVPVIFMIDFIVSAKKFKIEFFDTRVVMRRGIFNTEEKQALLTNILGVNINQSFSGKIFNYGDVSVDLVGRWDIDTSAIKRPKALKAYIESLMNKQSPSSLGQIVAN